VHDLHQITLRRHHRFDRCFRAASSIATPFVQLLIGTPFSAAKHLIAHFSPWERQSPDWQFFFLACKLYIW
jgi:hypothetical protein